MKKSVNLSFRKDRVFKGQAKGPKKNLQKYIKFLNKIIKGLSKRMNLIYLKIIHSIREFICSGT